MATASRLADQEGSCLKSAASGVRRRAGCGRRSRVGMTQKASSVPLGWSSDEVGAAERAQTHARRRPMPVRDRNRRCTGYRRNPDRGPLAGLLRRAGPAYPVPVGRLGPSPREGHADLPVTGVSRSATATLSNFNRQFRSTYLVTPTEYRRRENLATVSSYCAPEGLASPAQPRAARGPVGI